MKVYSRVYDWHGNILEEKSRDVSGPVVLLSGDGGGGTTVQEVKNDPWPGLAPYLSNLYERAGRRSYKISPYYPEQTYAGLTDLQKGGMYGGLDYMTDVYGPQAERYMGSLQGMMDAPQNITESPAVQAMMAANESSITDTLMNEWLPNVRRRSVAAGDYGGSKSDLITGQAMGDASEALARANAATLGQAYGDAVKQASYAASAMPGAMQLGMGPSDYMQRVGGIEQMMEQKGIDEDMARYYYMDRARDERLRELNQLLQGGMSFGTQQSTTTGGGGGASPLAGALGGGMLGYGLSSAVPALGPYGLPLAASGALLGGIFS